ncbi:hypothetical protein [Branchiibius cervicis]|uniref:Uncharacterized protein n=1 Tax=Branchiibius cervicis TaxID=908252 RepID=A0ABW2ASH0_9MICO
MRHPERDRAHLIVWLAVIVLCAVIAAWVVILAGAHWIPQGDNAVVATKVHDVFSAHPPLQGQRSTSSLTTNDVYAHHPGPIEFYLLAIPYALFGFAPVGLLVGSALVQMAFVVVGVRAAALTGGLVGGWIAVAVTAATMAGFGDLLIRPLNLYFPILGLVPLVMLAWRLMVGRRDATVWYVAIASIVAQPHISLLLTVAVITLTVIVTAVVRRRLRTGSWFPPPWSRRGVLALLVGLVLWAPVIVETFAFFPGNTAQLIGVALGGAPSVPLSDALGQVGSAIWPWGGHLVHSAVLVIVLVLAIVCCVDLARRYWHGQRRGLGVHAAVVVALLGTLAAIWTTLRIGNLLQLPYADALSAVPFSLAAFVAWWVVRNLAGVWDPARTAARSLAQRSVPVSVGAGALIAAFSVFVLPASALRSSFSEPTTLTTLARDAVGVVDRELSAQGFTDGPVRVEYQGLYSWTSLGPAVVTDLAAAGRPVYFDVFWPNPQDDDFHRLRNAPAGAPTVFLRDAGGHDALPEWAGTAGCVWHSIQPPTDAAPGTRIEACVRR